ncbi:putative transporter [Wickerhamomyces ciferrii]|uniref:Transporter n=1 Tax=Wickerhamomyces ciferrii (strain ATCC 14091 / BCRC 22168 / CBS 111 / JCM 3599 / NBRC 0793 / NRRL Y-1031 F-60-10) TaxID=1206466 RepID=K0KFQ8_WICCF|nr:putative transporter [Wickerhamomyces ciferrii]CCH43985.1 putative transporter [Wickerhamomyces ciferrii]
MAESGRAINSSQTEIHRRPSIISSNTPKPDLNIDENNQAESSEAPLISNNNENDDDDLKKSIHSTTKKFITPTIIQLIFCILGWYVFSLTISLYNKWMFDKSKLNLPFPILITSFHQLLLSILSFITIKLKPSIRPNQPIPSSSTYEEIEENQQQNQNENQKFDWKFYLVHILPCAMASSGDIGSGNMSFRFISLTTYTMVKSSSIAFVLLFGVLFKLEKFSLNLLGIVLLMSFGVMLMVDNDKGQTSDSDSGSNHFYLGFGLVLMSSCMSGLRWVFTQLLLHKNQQQKGKKNPIVTIYQLSPSMFLVLFLIGLGIEGMSNFINASIWSERGILKTLILLLFPGFLVFFMTIFEFAILQRAQVITLSIAGILKELLTILVSSIIFKDRLTFINFIGLLITLFDIFWYNYYRYLERIRKEEEETRERNRIELENV